ncbi:hypothetical protein [Enterococcus sp. 1001283B150225_161107_E12]|uniref:hypothetical protein n=1 Tax=Enterococcus sp. 1001283B150225_161107_E12 TaxID=2787145 RepID=UPI003A5CE0B6
MKKFQIKLRIWFIIGMLLSSFLSQGLLVVATTIGPVDQTSQIKNKPSSDQEKVNDYLKKNKLVQGQDGKLYTTTAENYSETLISEMLNFDSKIRAGNSIVYVDPSTNVANIDIQLSNGNREYGWYGKRVNGEIAMCIEQGVAVNVGSNGGYTAVFPNTALMERVSLIKYYGIIVSGHTL